MVDKQIVFFRGFYLTEEITLNYLNYSAVILAGGKGTRIQELFPDIPKPLIEFLGRPVLFWQIDTFLSLGINEIYILACYKAQLIEDKIKQNYDNRVKIIIEDELLGTGGCLSLIKDKIKTKYFIFTSGDLIFNINFKKFCEYHENMNSECSLTVHSNYHPLDADLIEYDEYTSKVKKLHVRPHPDGFIFFNNVNAAISILNTEMIKDIKENVCLNFEKDLLPKFLSNNKAVFAYKSIDYIRDIGTPERYYQVSRELKNYSFYILNDSCMRNKVYYSLNKMFYIFKSIDSNKIEEYLSDLKSKSIPSNIIIGYCKKSSYLRKFVESYVAKYGLKFDLVLEYTKSFEIEVEEFNEKYGLNISKNDTSFQEYI